MHLPLSRNTLMLIGIVLISFYYCLNKFQFIYSASTTHGTVNGSGLQGGESSSTIHFKTKDSSYFFMGTPNVHYSSFETVPVIYNSQNPNEAYVYSFLGFWYEGFLFCAIPICIWCAFLLSFFAKTDYFVLPLFAKSKLKKAQKKSEHESAVTKQFP